MPPISRSLFARLLRESAPSDRERFVAGLWAARGWETTVEDVVIATRDDPPLTSRIQVVARGRHPFGGSEATIRDDVDVVVAIDSPPRVDPHSDVTVLDADDLFEIALYAIDRETLDDLVRSNFDRPLASFAAADAGTIAGVARSIAPAAPARAVALGVVLAALLVVAGWAALGGPSTVAPTAGVGDAGTTIPDDAGAITPAPTVAFVPATTVPTTTAGIARTTAACPPPPTDAPPHEIRPTGLQVDHPTGLEAVRVTPIQLVTAADSNATSPVPTYIATYAIPSGARYRVIIQRWRTKEGAFRTGDPLHSPLYVRLVWGNYSVAVEPSGGIGPDQSVLAIRTEAEWLLGAVQVPGGSRLGRECVEQLVIE